MHMITTVKRAILNKHVSTNSTSPKVYCSHHYNYSNEVQLTPGVVVLSSIVKSLLILGMWSLPRDIRRFHHRYCKSKKKQLRDNHNSLTSTV